ncbi:hypothetical protein OROHE_025136 [Orobanche hederae]
MECNKDEALRAKSIAEAKLENKDFLGAKKFASKAQTLYPALDGISQMLTTIEVYISAEKKINGEVDWYKVLGVGPSADDETIKKQYRKLALVLHPDKNNSVGADGAFKLISGAWSLLSDKAKRSEYNQMTGFKGFQPRAPTHPTGPSAAHTGWTGPPAHSGGSGPPGPSMENPIFKCPKRKRPAPKSQKEKSAKAPGPSKPSPPPSNERTDTFWTVCNHCKIQYEYLNLYYNMTLLCPNCKKAFMALEITRPIIKSRSQKPNPWPAQRLNSNDNNLCTQPPDNNLRTPPYENNLGIPPSAKDQGKNVVSDAQKSGAGQMGQKSFTCQSRAHAASTSFDRAGVVANIADSGNQLKRAPCVDTKNSSVGMDGTLKRTKLDEGHKNSKMPDRILKRRKLDEGHNKNYKMPERNVNFEMPGTLYEPVVARKLFLENARKEISRKLNESGSEGTAVKWKVDDKTGQKERENGNSQSRKNVSSDSFVDNASKQKDETEESGRKNSERCHKKTNDKLSVDNDTGEPFSGTVMNVPDPDFYDFDQNRMENLFVDNEVWAAYDDDDGMPRFYALIHKVISKKPFKLKISWLNSRTTSEFGCRNWVGSGFYKTCGEFHVGKHEICKFVNAFSQKVKWSKGPRGSVVILPQKGDVWALYRNWSSDWNTSTPEDVVHKYDMVMVLDDYNEENGVSVARLVKIVGYRTVFRPNMEGEGIMKIAKEEMFRFSHLVPHHELAGREAPNAPEGCVELDPAATPLELLQMATKDGNANGTHSGKGVNDSVVVTEFEEIGGGVNKTCQGETERKASKHSSLSTSNHDPKGRKVSSVVLVLFRTLSVTHQRRILRESPGNKGGGK